MALHVRTSSIRLNVLLTLLFSFLVQTSYASEATKTIIGVDLGLSHENLETGKRLLKSILTQANSEERYGLVIADELVRTIIDPVPAKELLATFQELPFDRSDTSNFSALLERSLAMDDESTADTTRLWFISNGEIKLTENEDTQAKQQRYQMWASTILLPDIATRYKRFRMITPEQNNQQMVDAVIEHFGNDSHKTLPDGQTNVAQFVASLSSDALPAAETETVIADNNSAKTETDFTVATAALESNTTAPEKIETAALTVVQPIVNTVNQSNPVTNTLATSTESTEKIEPPLNSSSDLLLELQPAIDSVETTSASTLEIPDEIKPDETVALASSSTDASVQKPTELTDTPTNAKSEQPIPAETTTAMEVTSVDSEYSGNTEIDAAQTDIKTSQITQSILTTQTESATVNTASIQTSNNAESGSTEISLEVTDSSVADPGTNENNSIIVLAILATITTLTIILTTLYRRRRQKEHNNEVTILNTNATNVSSATNRPAVQEAVAQQPIAKTTETSPADTFPATDEVQPETIVVAKPQLSPDATKQASPTDETLVNTTAQSQENISSNSNVVDDFSAFDRSIIEKRSAKKAGKKLEPSDEK